MLAVLLLAALAAPAAAVIRVSAVGDSITAGVCASNSSTNYPAVLQRLLGPGYLVTNFGNSGKTMLKKGLCSSSSSGGDCSYWDTPTYTQAMQSQPDIVTICLGTNDAKNFNWFGVQDAGDSYINDYTAMIQGFRSLPSHPKVLVVIPPPLYPPNPYDMNSTVINELFPKLIPAIGKNNSAVGVIDTFTALGGPGLTQPNITCDGCHPRDAGYLEMAKAFAAAIQALAP